MTKTELLQLASQYSSAEEFKANNLPKYLVARKHQLLNIAFPPTKPNVKPIAGIFYLYQGTVIAYIGHSDDCMTAIAKQKESMPLATSYKIKPVHSNADKLVLYTYYVQQHKPLYNADVTSDSLFLSIPPKTIRILCDKSIKGNL